MTQTPASSASRASTNGATPPRRTRAAAKRPSRARPAARAASRAPSRFASLRWLFASTPAAPVILGSALRYVSRRPVRFVGLALVAAGAAWLLRNQYGEPADPVDEAITEDDTIEASSASDDLEG